MKRLTSMLLTTAVIGGVSAAAFAGARPDGAGRHPGNDVLFVMSNAASGNEIAVLQSKHNGELQKAGTFATGGNGSGVGNFFPFDPLASQNPLLLSEDGRWLFAVNAGSNQISMFSVKKDSLELVSILPSGGEFPTSLALRGNTLYVLNAGGEGNVTGFYVKRNGQLKPIPNSTRSLHANTPYLGSQPDPIRSPAQLQFSPNGDWLVVVDKNADSVGAIELFAVEENGLLADTPVVTNSPDALPFGFMFDKRGNLLVTEGLGGAVSSYSIANDGQLNPLSLSVKNGQAATCWIDRANHFAYVTNTLSDTVTGYRIEPSGELSLLDGNGVTASLSAGHAPTDLKVSKSGRVLYVVNGGAGSVSAFNISHDGRLTAAGEVAVFPALAGMEGLAVH